MSDHGIAPTTLQAMWPSHSLEAIEYIGHGAQWLSTKDQTTFLHANTDTPGAAAARTRHLERLIRADYERLHPDDTFDDLKRRARFSKEDKGVLRDWLALAGRRERGLVIATAVAAE